MSDDQWNGYAAQADERYELRSTWPWKLVGGLAVVSCLLAMAVATGLAELVSALRPDPVLIPIVVALALGLPARASTSCGLVSNCVSTRRGYG